MKTKIIPFDLETAKEIQYGKIKGKIKTRDGKDVLIVHWNKKDEDGYVILALVDNPGTDLVASYTRYGKIAKEYETEHNLVLEIPDNEPQFKPFDKVLVRKDGGVWCCAFFSHMDYSLVTPTVITTDDNAYKHCIPYEGHQDLVGTTDKPKED